MNQNRFGAVTRSLGGIPTRRAVLRGLAGAGLGIVRLPHAGAAKKKRKRKVRRNATTGNTAFCARASDCFPCRKDADCQGLSESSRVACIRCTACPETGGAACAYA